MPPLLLDSIKLENFKVFRSVTIPKLGRVNLIVGKNNVGKSSVLEALRIYAAWGQFNEILDILHERSEFNFYPSEDGSSTEYIIANIFHERHLPAPGMPGIKIGAAHETNRTVLIEASWYFEDRDVDGRIIRFAVDPPEPGNSSASNLDIGLIVRTQVGGHLIIPVNSKMNVERRGVHQATTLSIPYVSIGSGHITSALTGELWDRIALTDDEDEILRALQLMDDSVERISLFGVRDRTAMVRLKGTDKPVALSSLGEGMTRLLHLALALVNARNGFLIIDEFENGIHYSVQADIWRLVFRVAQRLNVQVFATSHSRDCIEAFQEAADESPEEGVLIRLQYRKGEVEAVLFDEGRLGFVTRQQIEVRG